MGNGFVLGKSKYEFLDDARYLNSRGSERAVTTMRAMRKVVNPLAELSQLRAGSHPSPTRRVLSHPVRRRGSRIQEAVA